MHSGHPDGVSVHAGQESSTEEGWHYHPPHTGEPVLYQNDPGAPGELEANWWATFIIH